MRQRAVLLLCGALIAASWVLFALVLALVEGRPLKAVFAVVFTCLAAALTWWAFELLVREWRGRVSRYRATRVSGFASLATLWLALTNATLPYWAQAVEGFLLIVVVPLFGLVLAARALIRRRRRNAPPPRSPTRRAHDERLAEKAFEARAAQKGYRG